MSDYYSRKSDAEYEVAFERADEHEWECEDCDVAAFWAVEETHMVGGEIDAAPRCPVCGEYMRETGDWR